MLKKTQAVNDFCAVGQKLYDAQNKQLAYYIGLWGGKCAQQKMTDDPRMLLKTKGNKKAPWTIPECI
jgi:hypothetical protein